MRLDTDHVSLIYDTDRFSKTNCANCVWKMNPILLRKQLQENASDLQDFCKDLRSWGEEMKRKEEALKNNNGKTSSDYKIDRTKKSKKSATKVDDAIDRGKVDTSAGCEKMKDEGSDLNNERNENMQDLAIIEKEKGNKFIKTQKWDAAIECYNKAIEYYSKDPIFYANRALCYLKKGKYEEAEEDCTLSLKLDNTYVKAYQRRAAARENLNKLKLAEDDLVKVLEIQPKNKESEELLVKLRQKLEEIDKKISPASNIGNKKVGEVNDSRNPKRETTPKKIITKIGTTDYAAWDKFDADAECEKLEDDINEDSELTDECNDNMHDLAVVEKEKGNKFVKSQNWDEAIKCYTKAIEYYSYDHIFYANRALCYLKKGQYEEAEKDCTLALKLDNTYVKAYQRRAAARENLNKLDHAEYDLLKVLDFEPENKESKDFLQKLRQRNVKINETSEQRPVSKFTASRNKSNTSQTNTIHPLINPPNSNEQNIHSKKIFDTSEPTPSWPDEGDIILVKPTKKPPHLRSKKPLKRINIIEKDNVGVKSEAIVESEPEAIKQHVFEKQKIEPLKDTSTIKIEATENSVRNVSAFKKKQTEKTIERSEPVTAWPRKDQQTLCLKSDDFKIIEKVSPDISLGPHSVISKEVKNTSNINISNGNKKVEHDKTNTEFTKPKTSIQFNLVWKNLKSEEKYKYLKQIDPQDFPRIFLNSMESQVFSGILEVLVLHFIEDKEPVFNILEHLTQVKRFSTVTMFMSSSDKNNLWKLFDYVKEVEGKNKEEVDRLIEKYEL